MNRCNSDDYKWLKRYLSNLRAMTDEQIAKYTGLKSGIRRAAKLVKRLLYDSPPRTDEEWGEVNQPLARLEDLAGHPQWSIAEPRRWADLKPQDSCARLLRMLEGREREAAGEVLAAR